MYAFGHKARKVKVASPTNCVYCVAPTLNSWFMIFVKQSNLLAALKKHISRPSFRVKCNRFTVVLKGSSEKLNLINASSMLKTYVNDWVILLGPYTITTKNPCLDSENVPSKEGIISRTCWKEESKTSDETCCLFEP